MDITLLTEKIEILKLSRRVYGILSDCDFNIINDLLPCKKREFMKIDQFGEASFKELETCLHNMGIKFDWELSPRELKKRNKVRLEIKDLLQTINNLNISEKLKIKLEDNQIYTVGKIRKLIVLNNTSFLYNHEIDELCDSLNIDSEYLKKERLNLNISYLDLDLINYNILKRRKIHTIADLLKCNKKVLKDDYLFSDYDIYILYRKIHEFGLNFNDEKISIVETNPTLEYLKNEEKKLKDNINQKQDLISQIYQLTQIRTNLLEQNDELDLELELMIKKAQEILSSSKKKVK